MRHCHANFPFGLDLFNAVFLNTKICTFFVCVSISAERPATCLYCRVRGSMTNIVDSGLDEAVYRITHLQSL
jgi:hypothetical protein